MQGPVGMRCKDCGKPVRDAFTSLTAKQIATVLALAALGGLIVGFLGLQFGFLMLIAGFFAGGLIVQVTDQAVGMKRGRRMMALVLGGILVGSLAGGLLSLWFSLADLAAMVPEGSAATTRDLILGTFQLIAPQVLIAAGATMAGAFVRLR